MDGWMELRCILFKAAGSRVFCICHFRHTHEIRGSKLYPWTLVSEVDYVVDECIHSVERNHLVTSFHSNIKDVLFSSLLYMFIYCIYPGPLSGNLHKNKACKVTFKHLLFMLCDFWYFPCVSRFYHTFCLQGWGPVQLLRTLSPLKIHQLKAILNTAVAHSGIRVEGYRTE